MPSGAEPGAEIPVFLEIVRVTNVLTLLQHYGRVYAYADKKHEAGEKAIQIGKRDGRLGLS